MKKLNLILTCILLLFSTLSLSQNCLNFSETITSATCFGSADGSVSFIFFNGTAPFTYQIDGGPSQPLSGPVPGLAAGCYVFVITDDMGCDGTANICVTEPPPLTSTFITVQEVSCNGECDGAAEIITVGGTPPYAYTWANGSSLQVVTGLCAGIYSVTVTDVNGCISVNSVIVNEPVPLVAIVDQASPACGENDTGNAVVSVTGGVPPYEYAWDDGQTDGTVALAPGLHQVTVTDINFCSVTETIEIIIEPAPEIEVVFTGETCQGVDGSASVNVFSGNGPFQYLWSTGANTPTVNGLEAGTYIVWVYDVNNCFSSDTISVAGVIDLSVSSTFTSCDTDDGIATVSVVSGAPNPEFLWSTGETTTTITGLSTGGYSVTVNDLDSGCFTHRNVMVIEDPACKVLITGVVYIDDDVQDCIIDGSTVPVQNRYVDIEPGSGTFTDANGYYEFLVDDGSYNITVQPQNNEEVICPSGNTISVNAGTPGTTYDGNDFYFKYQEINDLCISLSMGPARPGFTQNYWVHYCNYGAAPASGNISVIHDVLFTGFDANGSEDNYDPDSQTATWAFENLPPNQCQTIYFSLYLPPDVMIGTPVQGIANIDLPPGDVNPLNNTFQWTQTVTGSYDPNDKMNFVGDNPMGSDIVEEDSVFHYQIRFQNTGTDTAFTVVLRDTIDPNLDITSIVPLGASHDYRMDIEGENTLVVWFENIMLPDSNVNEPASNGFFRFDIKMKGDPGIGTVFENQAAIYFDFNPPVLTNTVVNTLTQFVNVETINGIGDQVVVFPNPVSEWIKLNLDLEVSREVAVTLTDLSGKVIYPWFRGRLEKGTHTMSFSTAKIPDGVYFLMVGNEAINFSEKIIVIR